MPIYEYSCRGCDKSFEAIVYSSTVPECPDCESTDLEKQPSVFAVGRGGQSAPQNIPAACQGCPSPKNGCPVN